MRISSRAIIIQNNKVLTMFRRKIKDGVSKEYYVIPGGGQEGNETLEENVIRELKEELGFEVAPEELIDCGVHCTFTENEFHGIPYVDNQVAKVFLLWKDMEIEELILQEEEIESVMWMSYKECKEAVEKASIPNCIDIAELELLEEHM